MKKILWFVIAQALILSFSQLAQAATFTHSLDFSGSTTSDGRTYEVFQDVGMYLHFLPDWLNSPDYTLDSATLTVTHSNNLGRLIPKEIAGEYGGEKWLADGCDPFFGCAAIGDLSVSQDSWQTDIFAFSSGSQVMDVIRNFGGVNVVLYGDTCSCDPADLWLDSSALTVNYTTKVPEPSAMLILGAGLFGLILKERKKYRDI